MLFVIVVSWTAVVSWSASSSEKTEDDDYKCTLVWKKYNSKEETSKEEVTECKSFIVSSYKKELLAEFWKYRKDKKYCKNKWVETYMRREPTLVEDRLCKKEFAKYDEEIMEWKRSVINY